MNDLLNLIQRELKSKADPRIAVSKKAYMKDKFDFLGIQSPERKVIVRFIWREFKDQIKNDWRILFNSLWEANEREYQYVAMDLMEKIKSSMQEEDLPLIESWLLQKSWWDTVDFLAAHMAGKYFEKYPDQIPIIIPSWMEDDNMWLNRTAIIYQLKYKEKADFEVMKTNILHHIGSKEFFINKACGWALRQHSKFDPDSVREFIASNPNLANLTIKEGSKYL